MNKPLQKKESCKNPRDRGTRRYLSMETIQAPEIFAAEGVPLRQEFDPERASLLEYEVEDRYARTKALTPKLMAH